jgi:hypothetical protein
VDNEADGQPTEGATGDDLAGSDDEDGVLFLTPLTPGSTATIRVTAAITGYLAGWFDWNSNGVLEASERVFADRLLTPGANNLTVAVPAGITPSALYSRFRFTTSQAWADLPTGLAPDGEVEDYVLLSVGGTLWRDNGIGGGTPNNGRLDGTEPRLANVAVQLLDSNGAVIATTTSDAQGDYIFYGVTPGRYTVRVPATQFQARRPAGRSLLVRRRRRPERRPGSGRGRERHRQQQPGRQRHQHRADHAHRGRRAGCGGGRQRRQLEHHHRPELRQV